MANETDKFWQDVAGDLGRQSGVSPLTPEEAQKEFEGLPDVALPESEIEAIIEQVTSGEMTIWTPTPINEEAPGLESQAIEEDVLQLNRNAGEGDAETDELLDELRRKALKDDTADGQENETGMGGDAEPPGEGD
ncbi:MAG: hypothetical protein ISS78_02200 [Phycisphaerae bacterium]|nr:hypothetical protein [Phycisphaerae bacterium]